MCLTARRLIYGAVLEEAVLEALLGCIDFIANSPDDVLDADATVRALESVSYTLRGLPEAERTALAQRILVVADNTQADRATFLRSLPEAIGLVGP